MINANGTEANYLDNEFLDKLSDNILIVDQEWNILFANKSATEVYGYKCNEMKNLNFINLIEHNKREVEDSLINDLQFNTIHYKKDSSKFIADIKVLKIDIIKEIRIISISTNANCLFDKLINNKVVSKYLDIIDEAVVVFTKDLNIYLWSKSCEIKFGYTRDEIYGKNITILIPEDRHDEFKCKIDILKKDGTIEGYKTKRIDKNGNPLDLSITISPMYDCRGQFMGALGIYKDITEKLNLEHKLIETEERLRLAIEGGRLGVWDWNLTTNMVYTSNIYNDLLGYSKDKIIYPFNEIIDKVHIDDRNCVIDKINRHFEGEDFDIELRMKSKDNNYKWFRSKAKTNFCPSSGKPLRMIGLHVDITEEKKLAEELKDKFVQLEKLKEEAENANKAKSQFIANISHEIRTPMNGVFGMLQLLQSANRDQENEKYFNLMKASLNHLSKIINDILDISKIESGKMTLNVEPFDLQKMINNIYSNLLITGNSKGLEISYYIDPSIKYLILGDESKLTQILANLISNAVKFTDEGFISFRTKVLTECDNKVKIEFRVKDTGVGIDEKYKDKLFHYFSQADISKNKKHQGTGLGLVISKQIAELLNGELTYESEVGKGTTFTFTCEFEKIISINDCQKNTVETIVFNDANIQNNKNTILYVEDNIINQEIMKNIIVIKGYNYLSAYSGNEAFKLLKENKIDLILMDIQLPELNGFEITEIIRNEYDVDNKIPIIAITAYAMREDKEKCLKAGMNDYISKPFEIDTVYNVIQKFIK